VFLCESVDQANTFGPLGRFFFTLIPLVQLTYNKPLPQLVFITISYSQSPATTTQRYKSGIFDRTHSNMPGAKKGKRALPTETEDMASSPPTKKTKSSKPCKFNHTFIPFVPFPWPWWYSRCALMRLVRALSYLIARAVSDQSTWKPRRRRRHCASLPLLLIQLSFEPPSSVAQPTLSSVPSILSSVSAQTHTSRFSLDTAS
jgi:hypothetical protein